MVTVTFRDNTHSAIRTEPLDSKEKRKEKEGITKEQWSNLQLHKHTQAMSCGGVSTETTFERLLYNIGIPVTAELLASLFPDVEHCKQAMPAVPPNDIRLSHENDLPSISIPGFSFIDGVRMGKAMSRWLSQVPGFAPCVSFNGILAPDSIIGKAMHNAIEKDDITIDGKTYRWVPIDMGFYSGDKGDIKTNNRQSDIKFPNNEDALNCVLSQVNSANLELKLALAQVDEKGVFIESGHTYHGPKYLRTATLNLHLNVSNKGCNTAKEMQDLIVKKHVTPFSKCVKYNTPCLVGSVNQDKDWMPVNSDDIQTSEPKTKEFKAMEISKGDLLNGVRHKIKPDTVTVDSDDEKEEEILLDQTDKQKQKQKKEKKKAKKEAKKEENARRASFFASGGDDSEDEAQTQTQTQASYHTRLVNNQGVE